MESPFERPTAAEATAALTDADAASVRLAHGIAMPPWFTASLAAAVAAHIATTARGVTGGQPWTLVAGLAIFSVVAVVQLARFRQINGIWLGGLASRVVFGSGAAASVSYAVALAATIWAASVAQWWLVALCAIAGGAAYALSGRRWLRAYRAAPSLHARGESPAWLALLAGTALAGLVLLVLVS
jgi:hypothetical protein